VTGEVYDLTYSEFDFGSPSIVIGDAQVEFQGSFPHYTFKISDLKFNIEYDFLVGEEEEGHRGHATYKVSDLALTFSSKEDLNHAQISIQESQVLIDGVTGECELGRIMNDFLTDGIEDCVNKYLSDEDLQE